MSETTSSSAAANPAASADLHSQHFHNMVMQIANTALTFLGAVPHPETGEHIQDLDMARLLIDQLAMLEVKTKGNLSAQETALLKQALMAARMAFVEATSSAKHSTAPDSKPAAPVEPSASSEEPARPDAAATDDERKKFVKKY